MLFDIIGSFLLTTGYFIFLAFLVYFGKWIWAAFAILCGDKETLRDFGNLCDKSMPVDWKYNAHTGYYYNKDNEGSLD